VDFSRLGRGDKVAAAGGLVLMFSLFLPWYSVTGNEDLCGQGHCSAFQTSPVLGGLLAFAALTPWILVWIVIRDNELSWPPGEWTMIAGMVALVLVGYTGLLDQPGQNQNFVSLSYGWFIGVVGILGILFGGAMSQVARGGVTRKPPGSF
jgi:hypothetical protein